MYAKLAPSFRDDELPCKYITQGRTLSMYLTAVKIEHCKTRSLEDLTMKSSRRIINLFMNNVVGPWNLIKIQNYPDL
jgi:hypothetical protein